MNKEGTYENESVDRKTDLVQQAKFMFEHEEPSEEIYQYRRKTGA